jgi:hypothetical protein
MNTWLALLLWFRWIPVVLIVLPASFVLRQVRRLREALRGATCSHEMHDARVQRVQRQVW